MKQFSSILLAAITLAFTLNLGVAYHYCGGELAGSKVVIGHGDLNCGMEETTGGCDSDSHTFTGIPCCGDELIQFSTDDFQQSVSFVNFFAGFVATAAKPYLTSRHPNFRKAHNSMCHAPPGLTSVSLPVIGVFLI